MTTSVGTKARKKQSSLSSRAEPTAGALLLEPSLIALENVCLRIMDTDFAASRDDIEALTWQQRFKNVVTPISLALAEYKGPRHFHNHYRHRADDDSVLHPVLEDPLEMLAHVCEQALESCQSDLVGVHADSFIKARHMLEHSLQNFLVRYKKYKGKAGK